MEWSSKFRALIKGNAVGSINNDFIQTIPFSDSHTFITVVLHYFEALKSNSEDWTSSLAFRETLTAMFYLKYLSGVVELQRWLNVRRNTSLYLLTFLNSNSAGDNFPRLFEQIHDALTCFHKSIHVSHSDTLRIDIYSSLIDKITLSLLLGSIYLLYLSSCHICTFLCQLQIDINFFWMQ